MKLKRLSKPRRWPLLCERDRLFAVRIAHSADGPLSGSSKTYGRYLIERWIHRDLDGATVRRLKRKRRASAWR